MDKEEEKKEEKLLNDEEERHAVRHASVAIIIVVLAIFAGIVWFTGILGNFFGRSAENIVLIVIAVILAVMLYKSKRS